MINRVYDKKRRALVDFLLTQSTRSGITMVVVISLISAVVWSSFSSIVVISWMCIGYALNLLRQPIFKAIQKYTPEQSTYLWLENSLVIMLFLAGLFWGVTSWMFLIPDNVPVFVFVALAIVAIAPSAMPAFSVLPYIWFIYASPLLIITSAKLYSIDLWQLSILVIINLMGLTPLSKNLGKTIEKSITLDIANLELLEEVRLAKDKAEQANLAKSQFLAATSHDLRQPLHAQGILLDALSLRLKETENLDLLNKTIQSNDALNTLFNSLLEISQLDAGTIKTNISHHQLKEICALLVSENQLVAQNNGLTLELIGDDCVVFTDAILLNRILRNLINNAIKFTQSGGVKIFIRTENAHAIITVSDTGIGIPESKQLHIFDEYYQLDNKARDRSKGIGLGLAIVRRMSELLNHKITLQSELGKGSHFSLVLPLGDASKVSNKSQSLDLEPQSVEHLKILLIDDEQAILDAMSVMLKDWNCYPQPFISLHAAEDFIQKNHYQPDLIISDYRLKGKETGLDAIRHLQSLCSEAIPALIISGDTDPQLLTKIHKLEYYLLHKPVKAGQLKNVIRILMEQK